MERELTNLGVTPVESKLYLALLKIGRSQAGELSRKTGIHRRSVYDALERLIEKGLVSFIKENNKRIYYPSDPKMIKQLLEKKNEDIISIIPQLSQLYSEAKEKQETLFFRGKEGIKIIFEDQINEKKEVLVIGGSRIASEIMQFYIPHYTKKRVQNNVKLKIVYAGEKRKTEIPLSEVRYLPKEFDSVAATNVYSNRVAIILWTENPMAILIRNDDIAQSYKKYFSLLWNMAKK